MKKAIIAILVATAFVACTQSGTSENTTSDSTKVAVDTTKTTTDSVTVTSAN
jgi:hypothetical protein